MPSPPPPVADSLLPPTLPAPCSVPSAICFTASSMSSASTSLLGTPSWAATILAAAVPGNATPTTTTSSTLVPPSMAQLRRRHRGCLCDCLSGSYGAPRSKRPIFFTTGTPPGRRTAPLAASRSRAPGCPLRAHCTSTGQLAVARRQRPDGSSTQPACGTLFGRTRSALPRT